MMKGLVIANICRFIRKLWIYIKSIGGCAKDWLQLNVNDTERYGYIDLGPTDDAENISEYMRALEWALNNKNIINIAIAGPYGAGKSSVISTFFNKHPSIKHINISFATFRDNNQEHLNVVDEKIDKLIEEGILKQLFYKAHYSKIPQSRYRKLHKVSFGMSFIRVIFTVLLFLSIVILFAPAKLRELIEIYSKEVSGLFGWNEWYQIVFATIFGLVIMLLMTSLFRWVNTKWKSVELNVADKAIIKADEEGEALSLNKSMDEILYFFEETDYKIVVIEDLDRFDTPEIYIKLREISKIINDYDAINRRIVFIYALRDDIFHNEDRTKFFDFIIPIVSYIDATNSGEYMKKRLEALKNIGIQFNISNEYIMNVAPFISDMRVLNNIGNEFIIYKKTIKDSQNLIRLQDEQMFSIMIFKNMYPEEFAKMQESEGLIKQAYIDRSNFIRSMAIDLQEQIVSAEDDKKRADSQEVLSAEDVKLAFMMKLIGDKGVLSRIKGAGGTFTKSEILNVDFALKQIGNGSATVYYRQTSYYGEMSYSVSDIEKIECSDGLSYYEKCDRAIARDKNHLKKIAQNLIDKQSKLYTLRAKTLKELIEEYGAEKVLGEDVVKNKLLVFMLRHGYIDDTYYIYINYFLPGSITTEELNFIINVRNYVGKTNWNDRIMHPHDVISRLFDYELEQQKECLNFDLADYFYEDDKRSDKKTGFTKQLAKHNEDSKEFIKEYYVRAKNKEEFIRNIAMHKPLFWFDICSDISLGFKDKMSYLKDIFMYLRQEDIVLQDIASNDEDSSYSISSFITESEGVLELLQDAGAQKVAEVLTKINVKLKNINIDTVDTELVRAVYENELFEISLPMLQKYADFKAGEYVVDFQKNIYTHILGLEDTFVIQYLEQNINKFILVILDTEGNTKEAVDVVLRCIQLLDYDEELSIKLISKMDIILDNLQEWINSISNKHKNVKNLVDALLKEDKLKATVENLDTYKLQYQFSQELCSFVDENIDALLSDENISDNYIKEFLKNDIGDRTIEKILCNYEMNPFNDNLNSYSENVVRKMIVQKYFKYTRSRYDEICYAFSDMLPLFAKNYWDEFELDISNISFDLATIDIFLDSDLDDVKKVVFLNKADASRMTDAMNKFVGNTSVRIPKKYLTATWNKMEVKDKPAFMVRHFSEFSISEIEDMFVQMPEEYHLLKQEDGWHEVLLEKSAINESLCKKLTIAGYISSYDIKKEKNSLLSNGVEKYVARVKARK